MTRRQSARDLSYASSATSRGGRAVIRLIENASGRIGLIRRAEGYEHEVSRGRDFWSVMVERYGLSLELVSGQLSDIPRDGPLIVIANHPFGILDGLIMGHLLERSRKEFRILAHSVFGKAETLEKVILPVSFEQTKQAVQRNLETRKEALRFLAQGGAIGVFPGGTVSTGVRPMSHPMDPGWRAFTARMIAKSDAQVLPVFFDGHNSRLFQLASHCHPTLRMGLLIQQFARRVDQPVRLAIGQTIPATELRRRAGDARAMMDFLRKATYELSPTPLKSYDYGYEFEQKHRGQRR